MSDLGTEGVSLFDWPLDRTMLVEASAGTGKTWTIAGLYVRYLIDARIDVENLLVVTYTEAATKELRGRIRARLVALREALDDGTSDDPFCLAMLDTLDDRRRAGLILDRAISSFDQAAIYTIHGFCQRVLMESAFESAVTFDVEVLVSERELIQEICDDFWRQVVLRQPRLLIEELVERAITPEILARWIGGGISRPYLTVIEPDGGGLDAESLIVDLQEAYARARALWISHRDEIAHLLLTSDALNRNKFRQASVVQWLDQMESMFLDPAAHRRRFDRFDRFTVEGLAAGALKGRSPPTHPFFDACSALAMVDTGLAQAMEAGVLRLKAELRRFVVDQLAERKSARRLQSFDDLLGMVLAALRGPMGSSLAPRLRERYRAAMIDEFQDTDPVQLEIFERIYGDAQSARVFVGDPKQSIYSFRGADLFAYLRGRDLASAIRSLGVNYRSDPALVRAVDALFSRCDNPFVYEELPYSAVEGIDSNRDRFVDPDRETAKLVFRFLSRECFGDDSGSSDKPINKTVAAPGICRDVANRIVDLLEPRQSPRAQLDGRPLRGGDIAVLVRTHNQAQQVQQALLAAGIASVRQGGGSVFQTEEAQMLEHVLRAVAEPSHQGHARTALVSGLFAMDAVDLMDVCSREDQWDAVIERFRRYHLIWREHGFMSMLRRLLADGNVYGNVLQSKGGERSMTNILHLAELLQARAHASDVTPEGLVRWLSSRRVDSGEGDDEVELRLESDADRVQIVTMHRSKGLEYPVVFCPFLWDGNLHSRRQGEVIFHDPDNANRATLDLGSAAMERHREVALLEEFAESLRLLYVALTRAGQRCYVHWGAIKDAGTSPLAWLLHLANLVDPAELRVESMDGLFSRFDDRALLGELEDLKRDVPAAVVVEAIDPGEFRRIDHAPVSGSAGLAARPFERSFWRPWQVTSFSRIVGSADTSEADRDAAVRGVLLPETESPETLPAPGDMAETSIHRYPRGARTGLCWHSLFEHLDFTGVDDATLHDAVMRQLKISGIDSSWAGATRSMIRNTLAAELAPPGNMRLADVPRSRRISELGFFFPVSKLDTTMLEQTLAEADSELAGAYVESVGRFRFEPVTGYVRGFIDLVFEHEGRYYLLDYKSNYLGPNTASYASSHLRDAMGREGYYLQYLLYTLAVHRYLGARVSGYDYDLHFGGVFYLFLRGIDSNAGVGNGIFFDRPPRSLIIRLDERLGGRS
jgi:exodeoxyribonuclease V beta subunit